MADAAPTLAPLVLVADDVSANVELLRDQLQLLGYRTVDACDGPSAVQACFEHRPDVCILDVSMPAGSLGVDDRSTGFEVCRRIKRDPRTSRIPVIFVTALNDTSDRVRAIESGGDDFLTKPHNRLVLGARLRSLIKLKAATDALEDSLRKLRELEKVRDDLMKMIVHDLKTPLTTVLATLEMLLDGDFGGLAEGQRNALGHAQAKAEDLLTLIEDLLEIARIEDSHLHLDLQPIDPARFLAAIVRDWELRLRQEGAETTLDIAADVPSIMADAALLTRVVSNLIQNALVHSSRAVKIRIGARAQDGGALITVEDDGPGIPPEYREVIFRKFETVKAPNAPRVRSSGLGLAFCKLVVDAHGGRIWVQSTEGQGSAFHLQLPLEPPPNPAADTRRA
ncbi:MAG TPA: hybrid sensor histidine kinase/response regulator [Gemmatimonadaceae bacterium]|jgi:signal transduction histidine kinase|nr:hybrid sensor histidine kinase/response regulator [Gemmatimonadaceae bacterium]